MKRETESGEKREEREKKKDQRGRRRRLSTREDEGKQTERRQRRGLSQRAAQPCRHGADNVMQGDREREREREESARSVLMTQALPVVTITANGIVSCS